jgi:hypothetical protein
MFDEWLREKRETVLSIGDRILYYLCDDTLLCELADRDLEKLARIFKLLLFSPMRDVQPDSNNMLNEILDFLKGGTDHEQETLR